MYQQKILQFCVKLFIIINHFSIGVRHPEELSLCKPIGPENLKTNYQDTLMRKRTPVPTKSGDTGERIDTNTFVTNTSLVRFISCFVRSDQYNINSLIFTSSHASIACRLIHSLAYVKNFVCSFENLD